MSLTEDEGIDKFPEVTLQNPEKTVNRAMITTA
jgi:hypothetical protein